MRKLILLFLVCWLSCEQQTDSLQPENYEEIAARIEQERQMKDLAFKTGDDSPIPDEDKPAFEGLSYFPIDARYHFRLQMQRLENPQVFTIVTSSGKQRQTEKYGYFEFEFDGKNYRLHVYKLLDIQSKYPGHLFAPFMDATSNKECYGGGRYLDFTENESGVYDLDFNQAYNPSCAYGKSGYNCPIPPSENWLPVAIRAGEKNYPLAHY